MSKRSYRLLMSAANRLSRGLLKNFLTSPFASFGDLYTCIKSFLLPIDYTRTKEIPVLLDCSGLLDRRQERLKILDIGSPQILSLALGLYAEHWEITYINPFEPELVDLRRKARALDLGNLTVLNADITDPTTLSCLGPFDVVLSCSVFEHIHPENGGDIVAASNLSGVLVENGNFVFSVPCYKERFNEYVNGDAYAVKGDGKRTFFQRFYDKESLCAQIIKPSGLFVLNKKIIGEKFYHVNDIKRRMAFKIGLGYRALILGRFFYIITNVFMEIADDFDGLKKPYLAIYCLKKT